MGGVGFWGLGFGGLGLGGRVCTALAFDKCWGCLKGWLAGLSPRLLGFAALFLAFDRRGGLGRGWAGGFAVALLQARAGGRIWVVPRRFARFVRCQARRAGRRPPSQGLSGGVGLMNVASQPNPTHSYPPLVEPNPKPDPNPSQMRGLSLHCLVGLAQHEGSRASLAGVVWMVGVGSPEAHPYPTQPKPNPNPIR